MNQPVRDKQLSQRDGARHGGGASCRDCGLGQARRDPAVAPLAGWPLVLSASAAFLLPLALAVGGAITAAFLPFTGHAATWRVVMAVTGLIAGIAIAGRLVRLIRPAGKESS